MKRTLLAASLVALTTLAACGSDAEPGAAAPGGASARPSAAAPTTAAAPVSVAPAGDPAPGVPPLTGTPTDLAAPVQAQAGTGEPQPGLVLQDVVVGTGPAATPADTVAVRYTGTVYADGSLFDTSWTDGDTPVTFPLDGVVPGFAQGIEGMQPGGRRVLVIPPDLGYGDAPPPSSGIPAGSTLVFVVDLVEIS